MTSHYNAYWNGNESLKEGVIDLTKKVKDDYNEILNVYNYGDKEDSKSIVTNCDRGLEKASKVIQNHSMIFHGKQYCKWIDDSYFLIGRSYFYKQEYGLSIRTFSFIVKEYKNTPISYEAMLWLARSYNQKENFKSARSWLDLLQSNIDKGKADRRLQKALELSYANHFILQKKYSESKKFLFNALNYKLEKDLKIRVKFILAQIFQKENYFEDASDYYKQVIKMNPVYDMAFQAKINLAKSYDKKLGDKDDIVKILKKMLKDGKNQDYLDQIYFALADVYLKDNKDTIAINYLKLSVSKSKSNRYQKAISSLKLANLYFLMPEYDLAQAYYDSTMQFLPKTYPDYKKLKNKTEVLTNLVLNLKVITLQDSLQKLAVMTEAERNKIIDKIILEKRKEEIKNLEEKQAKQDNMSMSGSDNKAKNVAGVSEGGWYFYNSSALSFGFSEFRKKWGNRKLEDDWRLKNKQILAYTEIEDEVGDQALDSLTSDSARAKYSIAKNRKIYLDNIPLSEEKLKVSDSKVSEALFNSGFIYIDDLNDINKSIDKLEELLERYPKDTIYDLRAYYKLYKIYGELPDLDKRGFYKDLIISKYPLSNYAKFILDPDYYKKLESENQKIADLYKETYNAYKRQQYSMVLIYCDDALLNYKENKLISKFEFLRDLSIGKQTSVDSLGILLKAFVKKYPKQEVTPLAENILLHIYGEKQLEEEKKNEAKKENEEVFPYKYEPETNHFCVLVVNSRNVNTNAVKIKTSDYNYKYNKLDNLTISSVILNNKFQIINISSFNNSIKAFDYYLLFKDNEYVFSDVDKSDYDIFIVSKENYKILYKEKNIEQYKRFFDKYYLSVEKK